MRSLTHRMLEVRIGSRQQTGAKFSAIAGLGVIHRGHLQQGRSLMTPYSLQLNKKLFNVIAALIDSFREGSHSLHFGRPEFALITGLPFGPISFALYTSGELKFRNKVFPHKLGLSVTILDVIGVIEDEEKFGNLDDEDSIRLCLILALEVIFMGRLLTCPVDDTLFRLVENLED
ncbi:phospholipase-like protein [Tanacetum coccineum]